MDLLALNGRQLLALATRQPRAVRSLERQYPEVPTESGGKHRELRRVQSLFFIHLGLKKGLSSCSPDSMTQDSETRVEKLYLMTVQRRDGEKKRRYRMIDKHTFLYIRYLRNPKGHCFTL